MVNLNRSPWKRETLERLAAEGPLTQQELTGRAHACTAWATAERRRKALHDMARADLVVLEKHAGPNRAHIWRLAQ